MLKVSFKTCNFNFNFVFLVVIDRSAVAGLNSYYGILSEKLKNDSSGLASVISKSSLDFDKLDEIASEESLIIEEELNLPLPESTLSFEERTRSFSFSQRIGNEVKDTVASVMNTDNRQMNTVILLLKIVVVIMALTLFFNFYQGYSSKGSSISEVAELKALVNSLSEKIENIQKTFPKTKVEL